MAQTLETIIAINAQVGNGFSQVGNTLTQLGSLVNGMSDKLMNFGKESVEVYRNYEMSMADAEVALSTIYGRNTKDLSKTMSQLDAAATEWAASTIFHTNDVANAIAEAAHAGWDYETIMSGIPSAMKLAQAGSLDLSEAVDYIVKTTNAAGIEFGDMDDLIDHWAFTANSSATTIEELGEAMVRMGATMKFAGGQDELLVMLAELANAGTVGSDAGTLLRNSMLRLVAPTEKAEKIMSDLGVTTDEVAEIMGNEDILNANEALQKVGFSAYNSNGDLKDMLTIYRELNSALSEIGTEEEANKIISAIFPTRTITGAKALLEAASEDFNGLYEALQGGDAADYGTFAAETMMDTLNGSIETFESKVERLKQLVGEELSEPLRDILDTFGGIADTLATMDDGAFSAIVSAASVLALAGPGLLTAGAAFRIIGYALSPVGAWGLGAIALAAAVAAIKELDEVDFQNNFGNLELDTSEITNYVNSLTQEFERAQQEVQEFENDLQDALNKYKAASSDMKADLLTKSLTNAELTDTDKDNLFGLGETMAGAIKEGIDARNGELIASITQSFGEGEDTDNPIWNQIVDVIAQGYEVDIAKAEDLSQRLRDAMTSAFSDGGLTADEIANIQSIIDQQNELLAQQEDRANYLERQRILRKGQALGYDAIQQAVDITKEARDAEYETLMERQTAALYDTGAWYDRAIAEGWQVRNTYANADGTYGTHAANIYDKNRALEELQSKQGQELLDWTADFNDFILDTMLAGVQDSDLSGTWDALTGLATSFRDNAGILTADAKNAFFGSTSMDDRMDAERWLGMMIDNLGGIDQIQGFRDFYANRGDSASAAQYQTLIDIQNALSRIGSETETSMPMSEDYSANAGSRDQLESLIAGSVKGGNLESVLLEPLRESLASGVAPLWDATLEEGLFNNLWQTSGEAGFTGADANEQITNMLMSLEPQPVEIIPEVPDGTSVDLEPIQVPVEPAETTDITASLEAQGLENVSVDVNGDVSQLEATLDGQDGQTLMEYVSGDASDLHATIWDENGQVIYTIVNGNTSNLASAIAQFENRTITVNIVGRQLFASGGRATTASIFGEAGPEWAIPEEHSERTAELLNAAREASGFTWPELLARYGGMNSNASNTPTTLVYSPTIQAADASGVDRVLLEDKNRLEKWWRDKQIRDEVEVYA